MPAVIVSKPIEIANELEKIGMSGEQVLEIIHAMVAAKADATENDPPGAAGWSAWRMGVRRAREVTVHDKRFPDWERDETGHVSSVLNARIGVRLLVANTDDGTGLVVGDRQPQNRSRKGAATDRIVQSNLQTSMFDLLDESNVVAFPAGDSDQGITSWYVCVYIEAGSDEVIVRAEVSCPKDIQGGFFTDFSKRIIIIGEGGTGIDPVRRKRPDNDLDSGEVVPFNIPVSRK